VLRHRDAIIGNQRPDETVAIGVTSNEPKMARCHTGARKLVMSAISLAGTRDGL
jgi:hypothetical protein